MRKAGRLQPVLGLSGREVIVLELTVNDHPGVMSHVCGLFSRRAFNLEGILCLPATVPGMSIIWLLVRKERGLHQMLKQAASLQDVLRVRVPRRQQGLFSELASAPGIVRYRPRSGV